MNMKVFCGNDSLSVIIASDEVNFITYHHTKPPQNCVYWVASMLPKDNEWEKENKSKTFPPKKPNYPQETTLRKLPTIQKAYSRWYSFYKCNYTINDDTIISCNLTWLPSLKNNKIGIYQLKFNHFCCIGTWMTATIQEGFIYSICFLVNSMNRVSLIN